MKSVVMIPINKLGKLKEFALDISDEDIDEIESLIIIVQRLLDDCKRVQLYINRLYKMKNYGSNVSDEHDRFDRNLCLDGILIELFKITEAGEKKDKCGGEAYRLFGIREVREKCNNLMEKYGLDDNKAFIIGINPDSKELTIHKGRRQLQITDDAVEWVGPTGMIKLQNKELDELHSEVKKLKNLRCKNQAHQELEYLMNLVENIEIQDVIRGLADKQYINGIELKESTDEIREQACRLLTTIKKAMNNYLFILMSMYQRQIGPGNMVRALNIDDVQKIFQNFKESYIDDDSIIVIKTVKEPSSVSEICNNGRVE